MNERGAIEYLHSLQAFGVRPGLERMRALCAILGNPQEKTRFVHVAGTNGKGSCCVMLESVLRAAGHKTGLFISPYVYDFCERVRINGVPVVGGTLAEAVCRVREAIAQLPAELLPVTEFEALTAAAFLIYAGAACDTVVLETGLGGRLDSTNIVPRPLAAVITAISLDHTAILGDTLELIAQEKCGIFKGGTAVIYPGQDGAAAETIRTCAEQTNTRLCFPNMDSVSEISADCNGSDVDFCGLRVHIPLLGEHMVRNAAVVLRVVEVLREQGLTIPNNAVMYGISAAKIPARMEVSKADGVLIMTDGGHNPGCGAALAAVLKRHFAGRNIDAVCGMMADKDAAGYLGAIAPHIRRMTAVTLPPPRGESAHALALTARSVGIDCGETENPRQAYRAAIERLRGQKNGLLLVCGSFVLAGMLPGA
ncbi:MAG: bifunctional folylpolyglutamate synthase/dihydrofolate synthase [Oscillospiraceae bacterium]|jgi:dihydrofolate synthase/folylpolyglutamate synthase|nr:bifunctional folylpolyglutamate synthase/dihydrofolate synthase [Oscillospiraceae bacterium]